MQKIAPQVVPTGDVDTFLVEVLHAIEEHNERVATQPGLDESLHVDIVPLVLDLLGVPVNRYGVDDQTGECTTSPGDYCRDWLHDMTSESKDKDGLRGFIKAARAEGCGGLMDQMTRALDEWQKYRADDGAIIPPPTFFELMKAIGLELARTQQPATAA